MSLVQRMRAVVARYRVPVRHRHPYRPLHYMRGPGPKIAGEAPARGLARPHAARIVQRTS
jgi:hypothetical protein